MSILSWALSLVRPPAKLPPGALPVKLTGPRERLKYYGNPDGGDLVDEDWQAANIITCRDTNGNRASLPGVPVRFYFEIHKLVEPHARRALAAAQAASPEYEIERAASFVYRRQRHDTLEKMREDGRKKLRPLSLHAWGIAIDIDPNLNKAREFAPDKYPEPWGPAWLELWPKGLPQSFVEAFEREGWTWGGRWREFCDPMHFQWDRRP